MREKNWYFCKVANQRRAQDEDSDDRDDRDDDAAQTVSLGGQPQIEMGTCRRRTQESDNTRDDNHLDNAMLLVSFVDC